MGLSATLPNHIPACRSELHYIRLEINGKIGIWKKDKCNLKSKHFGLGKFWPIGLNGLILMLSCWLVKADQIKKYFVWVWGIIKMDILICLKIKFVFVLLLSFLTYFFKFAKVVQISMRLWLWWWELEPWYRCSEYFSINMLQAFLRDAWKALCWGKRNIHTRWWRMISIFVIQGGGNMIDYKRLLMLVIKIIPASVCVFSV